MGGVLELGRLGSSNARSVKSCLSGGLQLLPKHEEKESYVTYRGSLTSLGPEHDGLVASVTFAGTYLLERSCGAHALPDGDSRR